ncbi:hypothetical protein [Natrinema pallidum]|uniref:Uncharacterized protein n=1 Tax=Natrinema pallidum DSM 3751 TaxID=1227495 RepID=L9Z3B8_9EURY|nr:hypothetical protein [Natrinema pallidum]ELY80202.1 hypothetical protein C487_05044 [Natrinema pallidum DSM 3751]
MRGVVVFYGDLSDNYVMDMNRCPTCGDRFEELGTHFRYHGDHRPELSDRQRGIIDYLILRGATVRRETANSRLEVYSTSEAWIRDVSDTLGWVAGDPWVQQSASDVADRSSRRYNTDVAVSDCSDLWAFTTVPHPSLDYEGPTGVDHLEHPTLRLLVATVGAWVGLLFGSLHLDVRAWDVSGDHLRGLLSKRGVTTAEYDGEGYAEDSPTCRYHHDDDVVVVPHYDALELLDSVGLSLSEVAEPITFQN